jgi:ribosome-associated heat shock protein Hsp15
VESVRIDRWLCAVRVYKSRTIASEACDNGEVRINGKPARPSSLVHVGDEVSARRGRKVLEVVGLAEKRQSPKVARTLFVDHSPPPPPAEERFPSRARGEGRPTKADRRAMMRFRGDFF